MQNSNDILILDQPDDDFIFIDISIKLTNKVNNDPLKEDEMLDDNKWKEILKQPKQNLSREMIQKIQKSLLIQNIPFHIRQRYWDWVVQKEELQKYFPSNFEYGKDCHYCSDQKVQQQIEKDLHRTFTKEGVKDIADWKEIMQRLLTAYSNFDKEIGYTQGMNYIVSMLIILMNYKIQDKETQDFDVIDDERNIFDKLIYIMFAQNYREMFLDGTPGVHKALKKLKVKLMIYTPKVLEHLLKMEIEELAMCFSQCYISLLTFEVPWQLANTILDLFFLRGENFIHQFIISILKYYEKRILNIYDMGDLIKFFRHDIFVIFFNDLQKMRDNNKNLKVFFNDLQLLNSEYTDKSFFLPKHKNIQPQNESDDQQEESYGVKISRKIKTFLSLIKQ